MSLLGRIGLGAGAVLAFFVLELFGLYAALLAGDRQTVGLGYYGLPKAERERYKRKLRRQAIVLSPILALLAKLSRFSFARVSFRHRGIAAPRGTCSPESFALADAYQPGPADIFVATQMKCGTTWMLHVVYQVLRRGAGDLVETGTALHAVCPWIEGRKTVSLEDAPLLGSRTQFRVIKTHLPASHCPYSPEARYLYVARHPVSCYASCADFIRENSGRLGPPREAIEAWFRSDEWMWWGTWPAHVRGWWELSRRTTNVHFVRFEDMKRDLPGIVRQVAEWLGEPPLTEAELARVVAQCRFAYMQEHQEAFEMHPPHLLGVDAELFVRGTADRHRDVPAEERQRIAAWCVASLAGSDVPLARWYPDLVDAGKP